MSLGFSSIWSFSSQALSALFPTSSTTSCPTTTASAFFQMIHLGDLSKLPPQSPFSTISLFQPFLDMHLSQLLTNKTKTTPQTNQSFGFPDAPCPFWQYPLMWSEGHGHLQRAVLCSHAKRRVENRSGPWQTRAREQGKGFGVSTTNSPAPPVSHRCSVR